MFQKDGNHICWGCSKSILTLLLLFCSINAKGILYLTNKPKLFSELTWLLQGELTCTRSLLTMMEHIVVAVVVEETDATNRLHTLR